MLRSPTKTLALAASLLCSSATLADSGGLYLGAQAGISDINWSQYEDDTSAQVYLGYMFKDWVGVEAGFSDLGSFAVDGGVNSIDAEAIHLTAVFHGESGYLGLNATAKVGAFSADLSQNCNNCVNAQDNTTTGLTYAVMFGKPIGDMLEVTAGWQYLFKVDENTDINLYQLGLKLSF